jgi:hypothetical protein
LQYILLIFKWASPSVSFPRLVNLWQPAYN